MSHHHLSRREFVLGAAGAGLAAATPLFGKTEDAPNRVGLVGTGIRGTKFWGKYLLENYGDIVTFSGLSDINPGRLDFAAGFIGADCPRYTEFDRMLDEANLDTLIVTTVDSTHHEFVVKGLERGLTGITEKPMTTDAVRCQAIIDAAKKSGRLLVGLNYRYGGIHSRLKEISKKEIVGKLTSVDFHWYLNTYHGASYFRRWHGLRDKGGTLLLHKAAHHFDLLNWWIDSDPVEVHAYGGLEKYGANNPFRGPRCMECPHSDNCDFFWDMSKDDFLMELYHANEVHDGYIRDNCLWREDIDIFDKMAVQIRYANDVQSQLHAQEMDQSSHTKLERRYHEIVTQQNFREHERELLPYVRSGHWGGDRRMLDSMFRGIDERPDLERASGLREGVMSVLVGIAARKSIDEGRPVRIADLVQI